MRPLSPLLNTCLVALLLSGCSASSTASSRDADTGALPSSTATIVDPTSPTAQTVSASHYAIQGSLQNTSDELDVASSSVTFELVNPEPELGLTEPLCATQHTILEALPLPQDPESDLVSSWQLTLDETEDCSEYTMPTTFRLGIGPYDTLLDPAAASAGIDGQNAYGLYLQLDEDAPLLIFGVTGTTDNFAGLTPPSTQAPLPDGLYTLHTLHLLPLSTN
jgi:hypothetical protein